MYNYAGGKGGVCDYEANEAKSSFLIRTYCAPTVCLTLLLAFFVELMLHKIRFSIISYDETFFTSAETKNS